MLSPVVELVGMLALVYFYRVGQSKLLTPIQPFKDPFFSEVRGQNRVLEAWRHWIQLVQEAEKFLYLVLFECEVETCFFDFEGVAVKSFPRDDVWQWVQ